MYRFRFRKTENTNQYEELIKEFLQPGEYEIIGQESCISDDSVLEYEFNGDREAVKREIYNELAALTGKAPKWGILTGIRPVKLAGEIADTGTDPGKRLAEKYLVHESKSGLVCDILDYQREKAGRPAERSLSLYIGIPFCPTRCLYCSFTSNQASDDEIDGYLGALNREIDHTGRAAVEAGYRVESVYIGGGTPTSLSAGQLDDLIGRVQRSFDLEEIKEFTVEAGRPDTITWEKLRVLRDHGIERISINPQTMKEKTLELIGRRHSVKDVYEAFELARRAGFSVINTDLIAGLPEENEQDFESSLADILRLGAENITLHTLAVKRASRLKDIDENFNYKDEELRERMLTSAHEVLKGTGYVPYYLYRQKHTSGNTENTGFCTDGKHCIYNIRIMEEAQSNLALGAGGISKIYFPEENRLERVANVSNYKIYIDRIEEMIERKDRGFFMTQEERKC